MTADALAGAVAAGSLAVAASACLLALRLRAQARVDRLALRLALARETAFVESARRLSDASRDSIAAVRTELDRSVRVIAPGIDVVLVFEECDGQLRCVAAFGRRVEFFEGACFALDDDESLLIAALRTGHRVTTADLPLARVLHPGDTFAAAIPLVLDAGRRCVLYAGAGQAVTAADIDRIVQLIDQATPAYRIALERADDRARAEYDGLTGLLTPGAFRVRLAETIERARCTALGRVGVVFVDTDRFKSWNDTYGHASGDALLRELAHHLRAAATGVGDLVGRNGGDEFCLVFADAEKSSTIERAERLRAAIADADFRGLHANANAAAEEVRISASIGIACFPVDAQSPQALLQRADEAMYHSKRTGRNGVSYFGVDASLARADGATEERGPDRRRE